MIYEIINPSDAYVIESSDFAVACVAVCILGEGAYSIKPESGDDEMPLFLFGGSDEWFTERFGRGFSETMNDIQPQALADCLDTVTIGSFADRQAYVDGLELIDDPVKKQQWRDRWHDKRRSSMNDIGARAWRIAEMLRKNGGEE